MQRSASLFICIHVHVRKNGDGVMAKLPHTCKSYLIEIAKLMHVEAIRTLTASMF